MCVPHSVLNGSPCHTDIEDGQSAGGVLSCFGSLARRPWVLEECTWGVQHRGSIQEFVIIHHILSNNLFHRLTTSCDTRLTHAPRALACLHADFLSPRALCLGLVFTRPLISTRIPFDPLGPNFREVFRPYEASNEAFVSMRPFWAFAISGECFRAGCWMLVDGRLTCGVFSVFLASAWWPWHQSSLSLGMRAL